MKIVVMVNGTPEGSLDLDGFKPAIQQGDIAPPALSNHESHENWTELQNISALQSPLPTSPGGPRIKGPGARHGVKAIHKSQFDYLNT